MIKRISPCPIIEANIQINCTFAVDQDVVVGLVYSMLQGDKYGNLELSLERLPILNLPEDIRRNDPNLRDKPWYKINYGEYFLLIGLFGVAIGVNPPYKGWDSFKSFSINIFNGLKGSVIKGISAITLKYLDFFSNVNIFEKINCEIILNNNRITAIPTIFRTELPEDKYIKIIQITNGVHLSNPNLRINDDGSLIEISLFTKNVSLDNFNIVIDDAHSFQKGSFFELLSDEFLKTFEIEYE